jgi:DNA-binding NarL/FixJ family response regulator
MGLSSSTEEKREGDAPKAERPLRAILADKHPILRSGLRFTLERIPGMQIVGEAGDGKSAVHLGKTLNPDLVVLGLTLPVLNGLEATARITRDVPSARVVILSRHDDGESVWTALKKGASGYLLKRGALEELTEAVQRIARGETYVSQDIAKNLFEKFCAGSLPNSDSALEHLTERQCEILQLIADGRNTKQIADELGVSPKTVDFHRGKLMERLNIRDVAGLVRLAFREKLLDSR